MAAGDDDTARMVGSEVGGYPPSNLAADDQNVPIIQASAPQSIRCEGLGLSVEIPFEIAVPGAVGDPTSGSFTSLRAPTRPRHA